MPLALVVSHGHPAFSVGGAEVASYNLHRGLGDGTSGWESHYLARVGPPLAPHRTTPLMAVKGAENRDAVLGRRATTGSISPTPNSRWPKVRSSDFWASWRPTSCAFPPRAGLRRRGDPGGASRAGASGSDRAHAARISFDPLCRNSPLDVAVGQEARRRYEGVDQPIEGLQEQLAPSQPARADLGEALPAGKCRSPLAQSACRRDHLTVVVTHRTDFVSVTTTPAPAGPERAAPAARICLRAGAQPRAEMAGRAPRASAARAARRTPARELGRRSSAADSRRPGARDGPAPSRRAMIGASAARRRLIAFPTPTSDRGTAMPLFAATSRPADREGGVGRADARAAAGLRSLRAAGEPGRQMAGGRPAAPEAARRW